MMSTLSALILQGPPTPEKLHQAETWARKALSIIEQSKPKSGSDNGLCEQALAVTFFNLASIREVRPLQTSIHPKLTHSTR